MAQRISRAKRTLRGRRLDQPGDLAVVLRVLYLVYTAGHAGRVDLAARGDPARPPAHPRHRGTGGARAARADAPQPRPPPGAIRRRGSHRHARPAGPRPVGHARDRRGRARPAVGAGPPAPRPLPDRGRHRRPARRRGERRGDRLAADPRLVRRPRRPHRRPGAPGPRRRARPRGRGRPRPRSPPRGCARPTGCARCSATATGGTPSAATCTSSAATCPPPPRRTPRPPGGPRTSPSATTWSARPPARGPPSASALSRGEAVPEQQRAPVRLGAVEQLERLEAVLALTVEELAPRVGQSGRHNQAELVHEAGSKQRT